MAAAAVPFSGLLPFTGVAPASGGLVLLNLGAYGQPWRRNCCRATAGARLLVGVMVGRRVAAGRRPRSPASDGLIGCRRRQAAVSHRAYPSSARFAATATPVRLTRPGGGWGSRAHLQVPGRPAVQCRMAAIGAGTSEIMAPAIGPRDLGFQEDGGHAQYQLDGGDDVPPPPADGDHQPGRHDQPRGQKQPGGPRTFATNRAGHRRTVPPGRISPGSAPPAVPSEQHGHARQGT